MSAVYHEIVWLKKALPGLFADAKPEIRAVRKFTFEGSAAAGATDGYRLHIVRYDAPGLARRSRLDDTAGRIFIDLLQTVQAQPVRFRATFVPPRGLLRKLAALRDHEYEMGETVVGGHEGWLTFKSAGKAGDVIFRTPLAFPVEAPDHIRLQAAYLVDALGVFAGCPVTLSAHREIATLDNGRHLALIQCMREPEERRPEWSKHGRFTTL